MPSCEREATDPTDPTPVCETHYPETEEDEPTGDGEDDPDPEGETPEGADGEWGQPAVTDDAARAAFADILEFFHRHIDETIDDHTDGGEHPDRPTTAREYFENVRGWDPETIDERRLGWAPPNAKGELVAWLFDRGHDRKAMLSTGVIGDTENGGLYVSWKGRYVLPYFDAEGRPAYAIARCTGDVGGGGKGYDGHPRDYQAGKYSKVRHTDERVPFTEPIWGLDTLEDGEPVVVAEGIADAITAAEAGYSVLSPVTKEFKREHIPPLREAVADHDVPAVYIVPDADPASFTEPEDAPDEPETIGDALDMPLVPAGLGGALRSATLLGEAFDDEESAPDVRVVDLPQPSTAKVDLDDYLNEWADDLDPALASAKPATAFEEYDRATRHMDRGGSTPSDRADLGEYGSADQTETPDNSDDESLDIDPGDPHRSSLWAIDMADVTPAGFSSAGDRGRNPARHTGDSETYFVLREAKESSDLVATDYKGAGGKAKYNALTYLLVDAGERDRDDPEGSLSDREVWLAWKHARETNVLPLEDDDEALPDPIPTKALWYLAREHDLADPEEIPTDYGDEGLDVDVFNAALDVVREEYDLDPERDSRTGSAPDSDSGGTSLPGPEDCAPPAVDAEPFDRKQRWRDFQGDRYEEWLDANRPTFIWGDAAGSGKTTNAAVAGDDRSRPHTVLFDKHEKAREFITDPVTPDDYFHLKGGEQPAHDCCMDATVRADEGERPSCPTHGDPGEWPRLNPIYERDRDDDLRERYEALLPAVGPRKALVILDEDGDLLEDNPWLEQFDKLETRKRVVGVHEYQQLKTAVGDRDLILDETPRLLSDTQHVTVAGLTSAALRLEDLAGLPSAGEEKSENLRALAAFATDVRDALAGDGPTDLTDVDPPAFDWERYFDVKEPMSGKGTHEPLKAETLAQVKLTYNETLVSRIRDGDWNGEPFCIDTLLAAAAEAGLDDVATRQAIAVPSTLDSCPWCGGELANDNGARVCASDGCGWHEAEHTVTRKDADPARAIAWLEDPHGPDRAESAGIVSTVLPPASDLPDPLVLDATATPSKVAAFYGQEDVPVRGDEPLDLEGKLRVTQVLDGQYHAQTIKDTPSLQSRIQSVIDTTGEIYDRPLFGIRGDLIPLFEFPENGEVLKYHAARGLNRAECDAVVCIGAPHPKIDDLGRAAELLAMDRDDLRAGGDEHSTRRDAPNPPVYRKLRYQDDDGSGVAVPTKHYTGLVGDLFRESRENELVQFVHRIRPLLVDDVDPAKDAYLLTNVPTDLPVDTVVEFDELAGDLSAVFPVTEGALRLLEYAHDALEGGAPDGFRPGTLVEQREDGTIANKVAGWHRLATMNGEDVTRRTVRNWVDDLEAVGLLSPENYEQRRGVSYAADPATSKQALQVLTGNAVFEVAAVRCFAEKVRGSDGSLGWLEWARDALALSGDRCEWGPPPDPAG